MKSTTNRFPKSINSHFNPVPTDINMNKDVALGNLLRNFNKLAHQHADVLGFSVNKLRKDNLAWALLSSSLSFHTPINLHKYLLETEIAGIKHQLFYRNFSAYHNELTIVEGTTLWGIINLESRALAKIPKYIFESCPHIEPLISTNRLTLKAPKTDQQIITSNQTAYTVGFSDCDFNGHLNNVRYAELALDCCYRVTNTPHISKIEQWFYSEMKINEELLLKTDKLPDNNFMVTFYRKSSSQITAQIRLAFKCI